MLSVLIWVKMHLIACARIVFGQYKHYCIWWLYVYKGIMNSMYELNQTVYYWSSNVHYDWHTVMIICKEVCNYFEVSV